MEIRLNKYLKDMGICSRRKADEFIASGYVKVNGVIVTELGHKVVSGIDKVEILPIINTIISEFRYIVLNKPKDYVCSKSETNSQLIFDLVPPVKNLTYAGRLDKDSQGLVLLSNDGKFVYRVAGSEFECEKEYLVTVNKPITPEYLLQQSNGNIRIDGKQVRKATVKAVGEFSYKITLTEGMNRQIRRMAENQGYRVVNLKRIRIGIVRDNNLNVGSWRELTATEIAYFYANNTS